VLGLLRRARPARGDVVVIGCGRLGATLASSLSEEGRDVTVVDRDIDAFRKLSPSFGGLTIAGSGTNLEVLEQAGIDARTTVICVTDKENINIMAAQMTRTLFEAGRVVARLYNPDKAVVFEGQDIETICPVRLAADFVDRVRADADRAEGRADDPADDRAAGRAEARA